MPLQDANPTPSFGGFGLRRKSLNMPELIQCRVCKKEMASSAKSCPHCGDPNPNHLDHWGCLGAVIVVIVSILILLWLGNPFE